jgi:uncharacterized protein GlcG (DUF336 family)
MNQPKPNISFMLKEGSMDGKILTDLSPGALKLIMGLSMVCVLGIFPAGGSAADLLREAVLPLSMATKAASAAVKKCTKDGYQVSAAIVDRSGVVRALLREDGAGPHTVASSRKKAYTAASLKKPTAELADLIAKMPAVQGLRDMNDHILMLGGGLPIIMAGEIVGGIGVGGAPGGHLDVACAQAGLESIGAVTKGSAGK